MKSRVFKQICYIVKDIDGYYWGDDELFFEDSSSAKRFHTIKDIKEEIKNLENWNILEVEFGFRIIRSVNINE